MKVKYLINLNKYIYFNFHNKIDKKFFLKSRRFLIYSYKENKVENYLKPNKD